MKEDGSMIQTDILSVLTDYKFVHVLTSADEAFAAELGVEGLEDGKVYVVGGDYNVNVRRVKVLDYRCDARCANSSEEAFEVVDDAFIVDFVRVFDKVK